MSDYWEIRSSASWSKIKQLYLQIHRSGSIAVYYRLLVNNRLPYSHKNRSFSHEGNDSCIWVQLCRATITRPLSVERREWESWQTARSDKLAGTDESYVQSELGLGTSGETWADVLHGPACPRLPRTRRAALFFTLSLTSLHYMYLFILRVFWTIVPSVLKICNNYVLLSAVMWYMFSLVIYLISLLT